MLARQLVELLEGFYLLSAKKETIHAIAQTISLGLVFIFPYLANSTQLNYVAEYPSGNRFLAPRSQVSAGPEMSVTFHVRAMNASLRSLMHNNVTHYTVSR